MTTNLLTSKAPNNPSTAEQVAQPGAGTPSSQPLPLSNQLKSRLRAALALAKTVGGTQIGKHLAKQWKGRVALSLVGIAGVAVPAQALNFNITYAPGTTTQQIQSVELAAGIWSSYLKDDITMNLHFQMTSGDLGSNVLAGATPGVTRNINYFDFKNAAMAEATAAGQTLFLPSSTEETFSQLLQDGSIKSNSSEIMLTNINAKALGLNINSNNILDGYIQMQYNAEWDYNYDAQTINKNKYDFVTTVIHEIGHNLGFISGLDTSTNSTDTQKQNQPTALDLFRYSKKSAALGAVDFSIGNNPYFSIDGGQTPFSIDANGDEIIDKTEQAYFSKGEEISLGGDGFQAGHWRRTRNTVIGIMDPVLKSGEVRNISQLDLSSFDYIGWNVDTSAVPDLAFLRSQAKTRAQNAVIADRSSEVQQMLKDSEIYNIGWGGGVGWWQTANSSQTPTSQETTVSVPEPNSIMGLLVLAGIAGFIIKNNGEL